MVVAGHAYNCECYCAVVPRPFLPSTPGWLHCALPLRSVLVLALAVVVVGLVDGWSAIEQM